jgi:cytochrome P450
MAAAVVGRAFEASWLALYNVSREVAYLAREEVPSDRRRGDGRSPSIRGCCRVVGKKVLGNNAAMSVAERTLLQKLVAADSRKVARWTGDRIRNGVRRVRWHAARLRMQAYDAITMHRRLPPGSLAASGMRDALQDDHFYLKQFARHGPIFKMFWSSGDVKVCIVGYPLARRLLNEHRKVLHPVAVDLTSVLPNEYLRAMDPKIHPHYRGLFTGAFRNDLVASLAPEIGEVLREELDRLADAGREDRAAHLYDAVDRLSFRVLARVVLGARAGHDFHARLWAAYRRLGPDGHVAPIGAPQRAAYADIRDIVRAIAGALRGDPEHVGDSILRRMALAAPPQFDETVVGNLIYMIERGRHDLRDLLRWILKHLSDHPAVVAELRGGPADPAARMPLAEACVMETLRLEQAEVLVRRAMVPFSLEGYYVPRGSWVCTLLRETHRDPKVFPDPDCYRPHRFLERAYTLNEYAPFGLDEHQCIGRFLNIRVATMFAEALASEYVWSVVRDGPRIFGMFHWQPSPDFAVELRRS